MTYLWQSCRCALSLKRAAPFLLLVVCFFSYNPILCMGWKENRRFGADREKRFFDQRVK